MKRAQARTSPIVETELEINSFSGINTFGPHADLGIGELRDSINMDFFSATAKNQSGLSGYIKTRRGSRVLIEELCPDLDILNYVVFDGGDNEYVVIQQLNGSNSEFRFVELVSDASYITVKSKAGLVDFSIATTEKVDMMVSNQKIYLFSTLGNSILEYDSTDFTKFQQRKMGMPAPQIESIAGLAHGTPGDGINGKRVYGVELVYKNTAVTPNVDIIVSGPNRAVVVANPLFKEGRLAYAEGADFEYTVKVSTTLNDGTAITAAANSNWTHARLYRSKDVTTATNATPDLQGPAEIIGREDELFQVQEMTKAAFLATEAGGFYFFAADSVADDDMPFPLDVVTGSRLDMSVIPAAEIGTFHRNRIWVSGAIAVPGPGGDVTLDSIGGKIFFTPESDTKYSESSRALDAIESDPGDGEKMIKLLPFQEDLLGIKEGKTGRVQYGDPNSGWITEDSVIGISNRDFAQFVPNVGICAIVNDQQDFRIYGFDQAWHSDFAGMQISRPIRDIIKTFTPEDIDFFYMNGKLFINGGKGLFLDLGVEQRSGWGTYVYPLNSLSEAAFTYNEGRNAVILNRNQKAVQIEVDDLNTDYNAISKEDEKIDYSFTTHKFQNNGGRSLIEQRWLSMVAVLETKITCQPYVNGKLWHNTFDMLLDPVEYPDSALKETEYQGYSEIKPIANYLHYVVTGKAPATIYSIMLNCLIQTGQVAVGFDPFGVLEGAQKAPSWAAVLTYKDASHSGRVITNFKINDASSSSRTTSNFRQDNALGVDRSN